MAQDKTLKGDRIGAVRGRSQVLDHRPDKVVTRDSKSGQFTLGRRAFSKVSEVEGIVLSRDLKEDLRRLEGVPHGKRRATLAHKYGKK